MHHALLEASEVPYHMTQLVLLCMYGTLLLSHQVGGIEEYAICDGIKSGRLFKPIVAWCIGTCAKMFTSEVQFGHAGACANAERETADAKNVVCADVVIRY